MLDVVKTHGIKIGGITECSEKSCVLCSELFKPASGAQKICFVCRNRVCKTCGKTFTPKVPSRILHGKDKFCSKECEKVKLIGKPAWNSGKGTRTSYWQRFKNSSKWKRTRKAAFERDSYTCVWCGKVGGILHPDHIKPKSKFPELMFDLDNIRTLCRECHRKTDTYGSRVHFISQTEAC